jgi:hypothetical protein
MTGIEPALSAWEADVLPLNYIRKRMDSPLESSGCGSIGSEQTMYTKAADGSEIGGAD